MANVTISLQDDLIKSAREYAQKHKTSLNALIRDLLKKHVFKTPSQSWFEDCVKKMKKAKGNSQGKKWTREDLYRV